MSTYEKRTICIGFSSAKVETLPPREAIHSEGRPSEPKVPTGLENRKNNATKMGEQTNGQ